MQKRARSAVQPKQTFRFRPIAAFAESRSLAEPIERWMVQLLMTIALLAALLAGCSRAQDASDQQLVASQPSKRTSNAAEPNPVVGSPQADAERNPKSLVAGCPGMLPKRRPPGSNCFGILPEECGADIAARHVGELMTETLARRLEQIAPGGTRIIRPKQVVHDDFRVTRLNVLLDARERIAEVDCY